MNLKEPKKKKHVRVQPQLSLPVDTNENGEWRIYTAHLSASGTCIVDPVEMEAVYSMGFFGKGSLSRSFPSFGRRRFGVPPIARNRQWVRRQKWLEELQTLNESNDLETSEDLERMMASRPDGNLRREFVDGETCDNEAQASTSKAQSTPEESSTNQTETNSAEKEAETELNSIPKEPCSKKPKVEHSVTLEEAPEVKETEIQGEVFKPDDERNDVSSVIVEESLNIDESQKNAPSVIVDETAKIDECQKNEEVENVIDNQKNNCSVICNESVKADEEQNNESSVICEVLGKTEKNQKDTCSVICDESMRVDEVVLDSAEDEEICEIVEEGSNDEDVCFLNEQEKTDDYFKHRDTNETLTEQETEPYEVLVLPDTDSDTENYLTNVKSRIEKGAFPINETLHLTFEETFFLMYGLGCLQLIHYDGSIFSISNAWNHFQLQDKNFIQKYIVYHYFRSKGWVVKPGLKFGGDFLLYKQGPPFYHASYIVIVEVVDADTLLRDDVKSIRKVTWKNLIGLERLSETIAKEILFAQILWPSSIPRNGNQTPVDALSEFTVRELLWRRWDPKRKQDMVSSDEEGSDSS